MFKATAITAALSVMLAVAIEETPPAPEATDEVPGPDPSLRGKGGGHGGHDRHWGDWFPNGNVTHFCKTGMTNEGFDVCCNATCIDTSITDKKNPRYGYQCGGKGCSELRRGREPHTGGNQRPRRDQRARGGLALGRPRGVVDAAGAST